MFIATPDAQRLYFHDADIALTTIAIFLLTIILAGMTNMTSHFKTSLLTQKYSEVQLPPLFYLSLLFITKKQTSHRLGTNVRMNTLDL